MENEKQAREAGLERQRRWLAEALGKMEALDRRFFWARLVSVIGGFAVSFLALSFETGAVGVGVTAAAVVIFGVIVWLHRRVDRRKRRLRLQCDLAEQQLARLRLNWKAIPHPPEVKVDATHPFASDLNLLGEHSLHQLLDTATSRGGSQWLADWLLAPVLDAGRIRERQAILGELLPLSGFRRGLGLRGMWIKDELKGYWDGEKLLHWLETGGEPGRLVPVLLALFGLVIVNAVLFGLYSAGAIPAYWVISLALYNAIYLWRYSDYKELFEDVYSLGKSLEQFREVLDYLETYPYPQNSLLRRVCQPFLGAERRPSRYLKGIVALSSAASLENNPVLALLINLLVPWNLLFAYLLGRYKASLRGVLPGWLETWYELEALASLANFGYLNPGYRFPEIIAERDDHEEGAHVGAEEGAHTGAEEGAHTGAEEGAHTGAEEGAHTGAEEGAHTGAEEGAHTGAEEGAHTGAPLRSKTVFVARAMGHPLIAEESRVSNDFALERIGEVAIVTGSNMSGKSTFLRTIGVNLCLALAGGPVAAMELRTGLVRLFTCIQVNDSLADGISYFYAEVRRLKALLDGLEKEDEHPLFFLIDEIFRGTNNRERRVGSQAYVRALATPPEAGAKRGRGVGLISTHDLELVKLAEIGLDIHNYHFREEIRDGKMAFDYRLRPGPCPTTNALKIMALEGLPVDEAWEAGSSPNGSAAVE
jgi:hypothetical protein